VEKYSKEASFACPTCSPYIDEAEHLD